MHMQGMHMHMHMQGNVAARRGTESFRAAEHNCLVIAENTRQRSFEERLLETG